LAKGLKNQAGGSSETVAPLPDWDPDAEEMDAMAEEYCGEKVSKQSNLLDF
jgi:hypothetical protein